MSARRDNLHTNAPAGRGSRWCVTLLCALALTVICAPLIAQSNPAPPEPLDDGSILIPIEEEPEPSIQAQRETVQTAIVIFGAALAILLPVLLILLYSFYRQRPRATAPRVASGAPRRPVKRTRSGDPRHGTSWTRATSSAHTDAEGRITNVEAPAQPMVHPELIDDLVGTTASNMLLADRLDTGISGRSCPECERIYDVGATYCVYDGSMLEAVELDIPAADPADYTMVCDTCGDLYEPGSIFCPTDGARLRPDDPDAPDFVLTPIAICPSCQREFPAGQQTCPDDGALLLPLVGRRTGGISLDERKGTRSRICPACGERYRDEARFCGRDGERLANLN